MYKVRFHGATRNPAKLVERDKTVKDFISEYGGHVGVLMWNGSAMPQGLEEYTFAEIANMEGYRVVDEGDIFIFDSPKMTNA